MGIKLDVNALYEDHQKRKNANFGDFVPELERLSVIIITKNEEKNIARCLESVTFADEIVLVDSGSTDKTIEIARQAEKIKIIETLWYGFVENKKIAVKNATYNWIFWIDADEVAPKEIALEWFSFREQKLFHEIGAIDLARKTFFLNHWVKHSGWYPNRVIRFFHKNHAFFNENILHEGVVLKPGYRIEHFKTNLLHYSYSSLYQYFNKMNVYGIAGAKEIARKKKIVFLPQLIFQPIWTFIRFYFLKKGFLDGWIGIIVCMGAAFSNFIKYANYFYLKKCAKNEDITK